MVEQLIRNEKVGCSIHLSGTMENPRESAKNLLRWLVTHGYSDDDIGKVLGGNVMRVLRAVWK